MGARRESLERLDFSEWVRPGDGVIWGQVSAEPTPLTELLMEQRAEIGRFRVFLGLGVQPTVRPEHTDFVTPVSYTGSGPNRLLAASGLLEILPSHYSTYPKLIASRRLPADVVLLQVAGPDRSGRYSLAAGDEWLTAAIKVARVIIAEVNDQAPFSSSNLIDEERIDVVVATSRPVQTLSRRAPSSEELRIAELVGGIVEDGSTLQLGLGTLPEAIAAGLSAHSRLGIHSGAIGDAAADLIEHAAVDNSMKSSDRGRTVCGSLMGTERLLRFADRNPDVLIRDTAYTHDPERLAAQTKFVAINSAFEVDLTGQINSETIRGRYAGAVGGVMDFLRGASRSEGGLGIVALTSSGPEGSRIVHQLSDVVSTPRADVGVVVTEFGIADLRGLTLNQRRERMLAIAHPDHQPDLDARRALTAGQPV